ncbi:hypothetical protein Bca52824_076121 [Brassica carinata]|uniref:CCHC-type domain-containing protein n=1 Tax=Brassica carinata TaxID=52824 RepID=A0A8X7PU56_BRACI|nr:hypothetical protein Bca52824_076121 [Brassica carinata]
MTISISVSPSGAPIDPGGVEEGKISGRVNQIRNRELEVKLQASSVPASIPASRAPSYAARLKSSLRNLHKVSDPTFLDDGTPKVQAPESVLLETSELCKDHIVAHFHGRRPSVTKILADLNPVWGKFGKITVRTVSDTCVLIFIPSVQSREWVLQVGYWQVDRCAFSVYPWSTDGNLAAQELLFAPTWAVLKNVPPQLYSLKGISVVASGIGEPLHTENSHLDPYHFGDTKVKVEIDLAHNPPKVVEYPSLPPKCINCGNFGHLMNRCHKPLMKRQHVQRKEKVISVVKVVEEVLLVEEPRGDKVAAVVGEEMKKSRVRSRSRRRARSRARARALSSPPEVLSVAESEELPVAKKDDQKKGGRSVVVKDSSKEVMLSSKDELFVLGEIQLEEGEIGVEGGRESIDMSSIGRKESRNQDDEKGFWITKHSKHYRRALREMESWRALGSIGNPPKSAKILIRGSSSETHVHESNLHSVLEAMALGWRFDNNYSVASGGRIWLMWSQNLSVVVYLKTEQLILCGVLEPATGMSCTVSFVYAQNTEEERRVLWRNLVMIARNSLLAASPFVVLGDFNQILTAAEHFSLQPYDFSIRFYQVAGLW